MPFIRHLRDRRGYETTIVMHGYRSGQGTPQSRVLYLFRSPAQVQVGREALDEEAREALEHTHPDLSFDWIALNREHESMRAHQFRDHPPAYERRPPARQERSRQQERPRQPVKVVVEDHSVLGKALGAERASSLRTLYAELVNRINRRARTPEERDRLLERAQRLNPDDWPDEAAARAGAAGFDTDRQGILGELPSRRRGRRGGRRPGQAPGGADLSEGSAGSEIMGDETREAEEGIDAILEPSDVEPSGAAGDRGVDDRARAGRAVQSAAGDGLSGDDEFRRD